MRRNGESRLAKTILAELKQEKKMKEDYKRRKEYEEKDNMYNDRRRNMDESKRNGESW